MADVLRERRMLHDATAGWGQDAENLLDVCDSPIERLFVLGMLNDWWLPGHLLRCLHGSLGGGRAAMRDCLCGATCSLQHEFALPDRKARVDMYAVLGRRVDGVEDRWSHVVVELDGHDFHERTRKQATRDKSRDRLFASAGVHVLRFTGSEVHADPVKCARELRRVLYMHVGFDPLTYEPSDRSEAAE